jgi:hypothetical protein
MGIKTTVFVQSVESAAELPRTFADGNEDYNPYSKSLISLDKVLTRYIPILPLRHLPMIIGPNIPESVAIS